MKQKISHPMADTISMIKEGPGGLKVYAGQFTSEIAFFKDGEWVTDILPEFAEYAEGDPEDDTLVYCWVPDSKIYDFVNKYMVERKAGK
jgi:hypothetical protein